MLTLASGSPRRGELLAQVGIDYERVIPNVDESRLANEPCEDYVLRVATTKAQVGSTLSNGHRPVLGADTVVIVDDDLLGKPIDDEDAWRMLNRLSGRSHRVLTAIAVSCRGKVYVRTSESLVTFRPLTVNDINTYIATGEPADKAGAYGIQGLGAWFIARLEGSYSGVMGLPLFELGEILDAARIPR